MNVKLSSICSELQIDALSLNLNESAEDISFTALSTCLDANENDITFISDAKYLTDIQNCRAKALIISNQLQAPNFNGIIIKVERAYFAYAKISRLFSTVPKTGSSVQSHIHPTAFVSPSAKLGERVYIGANAVIEEDVVLEDDCQVWPGSVINAHSYIAKGSILKSNVSVYHNCKIGEHCLIHSGTVIGSDGFGFAPTENGWQKIYQNGTVQIGNNVEIGSNCSIDRGAIGATIISNNVIIDNLVHIAHNVFIGENTAVAGQSGIAGSTKIGKNCTIAGQCGFAGHLDIADNCHFTGQAMVTKSISEPGIYSSGLPLSDNKSWRKLIARLRKIDELTLNVKKLLKAEK
ncbi:UDP-3-O-(3-hydroxymyristoyl)glucosamine N-acyltransferase [Marinicellulosiphila megalodicopiae]|uniref:UDP-3-O-(3-hydroxymyristoyl)glucosamine N-acyltransferase n=1 Tax=Marinicellulosiphila megalodicopiae TaxID=2724896 RepID=UPI003BB0A190